MKGYLKLYEWADSLTECGQFEEVGAGMIFKLRKVIREAYKNGFADAKISKKESNVQTRTGVRGRRFCG